MGIIDTFLRWRTSRGFGVQSPSAYSFIRYVTNEKYPYYCYSSLKSEYPNLSFFYRKRLELYFRLSNFWQPDFVVCDHTTEELEKYSISGCGKVKFSNNDIIIEDISIRYIYIIRCTEESLLRISKIKSSNIMIIVEGIDSSVFWEKIVSLKNVVRSYDLKDIGILFFDGTKLKEHYRLLY